LPQLAKTTTYVTQYPDEKSEKDDQGRAVDDQRANHLAAELAGLLHDESGDSACHALRLAPIRLCDSDVQRDGAEPDAPIAHVAQTRASHRVREAKRARETLDGFGQVRVRRAIAGHQRADGGNDALKVKAEDAVPAGHARPRDVERDDETARHGDAAHLREP